MDDDSEYVFWHPRLRLTKPCKEPLAIDFGDSTSTSNLGNWSHTPFTSIPRLLNIICHMRSFVARVRPSTPNQDFSGPSSSMILFRKTRPCFAQKVGAVPMGRSLSTRHVTREESATNIGVAAELQSCRHHSLACPR